VHWRAGKYAVNRAFSFKGSFELLEVLGVAGFSQFDAQAFQHLIQQRQHPAAANT